MNQPLSERSHSRWPSNRGQILRWSGLALCGVVSSCSALPNAYEAQLADHLTASGAKLYGARWCPHSAAQRNAFAGAINSIPYVECDAAGYNAQPEACQAAEIVAYPTWVIGGDRYIGIQTPGKLARLSGFEQPAVRTEEPATSGSYSVPR